ncbi:MAG: lipid-A-disaccharide synthase [Cyanobacteriota/Melainabacteria group bacterium]
MADSRAASKSVMVIVGDVSADRHASYIIRHFKDSEASVNFWGTGGDAMQEAGVELLHHLKDFGAAGITASIKYIPTLIRIGNELIDQIESRKPDMVLLVDFGGFNMKIAKKVRKLYPELPILYFISPQIWASRPWRINGLKRSTSKMLVIFPFEEAIYREKGVPARFVGHPLNEQIPKGSQLVSRQELMTKVGIEESEPKETLISIFPGSRKQELKDHSPVLLQAMEEILERRPHIRFLISMASENLKEIFENSLRKSDMKERLGKEIFLINPADNYAAMYHADLVWAKSGTTTLEVAMFAKPMLIFYRGDWFSYLAVMVVKTIKNIGLPNLLAGKKLVPELLQLDCSAKQFVRYSLDLLDVPGLRKEISEELSSIRNRLGKGNYITNCAEEIRKILQLTPDNSA